VLAASVLFQAVLTTKQKCRALNNFSTLTSIMSALATAPIARLKRTWDQVPQRIQGSLETMRKLMTNTKNFSEYREALHAANPPCIPFFGTYPPLFDKFIWLVGMANQQCV
jgi:son of sevenless